MAVAKKIEYKVCSDENEFSDDFMDTLHEFVCKVGVVTPVPAP
jgi:hypothetical protein